MTNRLHAATTAVSLVLAQHSFSSPTPPPADSPCQVAAADTKLADGEKVGPFIPESPVDHPTIKQIVLINGFDTSSTRAIEMAKRTAEHLKVPVALIFNDLYVRDTDWFIQSTSWIEKSIATVIEKLGDADCSVNAATETALAELTAGLADGRSVYFIVHSAGALSLHNALNQFAECKDRAAELKRVHIVTVGSAVFEEGHPLEDGWPEQIGSIHHLYDIADPIAQLAGPTEWSDSDRAKHSYLGHYLSKINLEMLATSGSTILRPPPLEPEKSEPDNKSPKVSREIPIFGGRSIRFPQIPFRLPALRGH